MQKLSRFQSCDILYDVLIKVLLKFKSSGMLGVVEMSVFSDA